MSQDHSLKRSLSLPLITLYGLGTTIGAGIYALIGKVAGAAGALTPFSFLLAALLAAFTACSFAELGSRLPKSAGEAVYVREGLRSARLALAVGLLVVITGIVSAAAITNGAVGYIHEFFALPRPVLIPLLVLALGAAAAWGISESVGIAALFTVIEIGGLFLVLWAGRESLSGIPAWGANIAPAFAGGGGAGVVAGAYLAFYAFLGFEDMVNVAEEIKDVKRNLPAAILLTLGATTLVYFAVTLVAILAVPAAELAGADAPLTLIVARGTGSSPVVISIIAIFAVLNGALIQIIMAARVLYGLSAEGRLPRFLGLIHPITRTPILATAIAAGAVLVLALWFPMEILAEATSVIMLAIFTLVNLALVRIKRRDPNPSGTRVFPVWVPWAGFLVSGAFLAVEIARRFPF